MRQCRLTLNDTTTTLTIKFWATSDCTGCGILTTNESDLSSYCLKYIKIILICKTYLAHWFHQQLFPLYSIILAYLGGGNSTVYIMMYICKLNYPICTNVPFLSILPPSITYGSSLQFIGIKSYILYLFLQLVTHYPVLLYPVLVIN